METVEEVAESQHPEKEENKDASDAAGLLENLTVKDKTEEEGKEVKEASADAPKKEEKEPEKAAESEDKKKEESSPASST